MGKKTHRIRLLGATDSDMEALVDILIENECVFGVSAADYQDGYELRIKFIDGKEPEDVTEYLSKVIPKRFGAVQTRQ